MTSRLRVRVIAMGSLMVAVTVVTAQQLPRDRAETPAADMATVAGAILDRATGRPIPNAHVDVLEEPDHRTIRTVMTDAAGRFEISTLAPGAYRIFANARTFVATYYGAAEPGQMGKVVTIVGGQSVTGLTIETIKGAALSGRVVDQSGAPAEGADIRISGFSQPQDYFLANSAGGSDTTDGHGAYRVFGLAPGDYIVSVQMNVVGEGSSFFSVVGRDPNQAPHAARFTRVFFPDSTEEADAQRITLRSGEERGDINLRLRLVQTARVSGTIAAPAGVRTDFVTLYMTALDPNADAGSLTAHTASGSFRFDSVPQGRYLFRTYLFESGARAYWILEPVVIGAADMTNISLALQPAMTVSGQVAVNVGRDRSGADNTSGLTISLSEDGRMWSQAFSSVTDAAGRFVIKNLPPARYRWSVRRASSPPTDRRVVSVTERGATRADDIQEIEGGRSVDDVTLTIE